MTNDYTLPRRERAAFGFGSVATNAISQAWGLWLIYFYAPPADADRTAHVGDAFGIDARLLLGATLTAARLVEALDDPLIAYWTDRTRSRWGRRVPFIVLGTPLWGLLFFLLFTPPVAGESAANLLYLLGIGWAFYMLSNLAGAPFEALLPHIARTNSDRVSVATWQVIFGVAGAVVGLSVSSLLLEFTTFPAMAATIASIAVATRLGALFGVWRHAVGDRTPATGGVRSAVVNTFRNQNFQAFLPSFVLFQVGLQLLTAALPFYVDTILGDATLLFWNAAEDEELVTFVLTGAVLSGMLASVPVFARYARGSGKARAYSTAMLGATLWFPALYLIGLVPGVPDGLEAALAILIAGVPVAGVYVFPGIITADIVDDDARRTGIRREAMFYGAQNLVEKLATSLAPLIFALVLLAGDTAEDPTGIRLVGPVAGVLVFIGYLFFRRYRLEDPDPL